MLMPIILSLGPQGSQRGLHAAEGGPGLHPHHDHHWGRGPVEHDNQDHHEEHWPQVQVDTEIISRSKIILCLRDY